jgi:hypothetical protein
MVVFRTHCPFGSETFSKFRGVIEIIFATGIKHGLDPTLAMNFGMSRTYDPAQLRGLKGKLPLNLWPRTEDFQVSMAFPVLPLDGLEVLNGLHF